MGFVDILRVHKGAGLPCEFVRLPLLRPPNMDAINNPNHLWTVWEEWKAPAIDGMQVCVRGPVKLQDGSVSCFFTDGISVPQLAWSIFNLYPFSMPELCAALGHDIVYSAELVDRKTCDEWMFEWGKMAGVSSYRRHVIYKVLRMFGWFVWKQHTPQSVAMAKTMCQLVVAGADPVWEPISNEEV